MKNLNDTKLKFTNSIWKFSLNIIYTLNHNMILAIDLNYG